MDDPSTFNQSRWDALVEAGVLFSRPLLNLTPASARAFLDPYGMLDNVTLAGREVLCLASGGGQQSAAFGVLGASVHVLDLSQAMLQRDQEVSAHYGIAIDIQQGDMRDLSRYADASFDLVWQPYSLNYIPDARPVFREVARVLKPGGFYQFMFHNPFLMGMTERSWDGSCYPLRLPYVDGAEIIEPNWEFDDAQGNHISMPGPRAFRHSLGPLLTGLAGLGFVLQGLWEEVGLDEDNSSTPGSWDHYMRIAPPWLSVWLSYRPT